MAKRRRERMSEGKRNIISGLIQEYDIKTAAAYPNTKYQCCIVHQVRNTLKYVSDKDKKAFANNLKSIYHAPNEEAGYERMREVTEKWQDKYPNSMKCWEENWDVISPMFKFSADGRKVMYTTNAIESLNSASPLKQPEERISE